MCRGKPCRWLKKIVKSTTHTYFPDALLSLTAVSVSASVSAFSTFLSATVVIDQSASVKV